VGTEEVCVFKWKYYGALSFLEGRNVIGKPSATTPNLEVLHAHRESAGNTTEEKSGVLIRLPPARACRQ